MDVMRRDEFISYLADRNGIPVSDAQKSYHMVMQGIEDVVSGGKTLTLVRFGSFFIKTHKGHAVFLCPGVHSIGDYAVFKFTPAVSLTRRVREKLKEQEVVRDDGTEDESGKTELVPAE